MRKALLYLWGARALYLGPAFDLTPHRNAVGVLCAGVARDFEVADDPSTPDPDFIGCRTALIPANTLHHLRSDHQPLAFLHVDAQSDDYTTLRAGMMHAHGRIGVGLARAPEYLDALALLLRGNPWRESRERIAKVLGLHVPTRRDERIAQAVRQIHTTAAVSDRLSDFAGRADLSASRFLHLFKQTTGVPFRRYRLWARMGIAVRGAVSGNSLTRAAHDAGFSSSSHFSTAFREMFGMPPSLLEEFGLSIVESAPPTSHPAQPH